MSAAMVLVVVAVGVALFGVWKHVHDGRLRAHTEDHDVPTLSASQIGADLGPKATLVQFTSAFCAPCKATRRILDEVTEMVPGVVHVDLDVDQYLELARSLDVSRTPTVLVLDADGVIVKRAAGQPRKADVIAALGEAIPS